MRHLQAGSGGTHRPDQGIDPKKAHFSFICYDLSHLTDYTKSVDTPLFRILKKALPGPYTFILPASKQVPKLLKTKRDTVGIRVPDNLICRTLVNELGNPIMSASSRSMSTWKNTPIPRSSMTNSVNW